MSRAKVPSPPASRLSSLLRALPDEGLTVGSVMSETQHAGIGFLAAFLAIIATPFVGVSTLFGIAIAGLGVQMIMGMSKPWLPRKVTSLRIPPKVMTWLKERLPRWTDKVERLVKPRLATMTRGLGYRLVGMGLVLHGIGLALPLPIPASNLIFILPVVCYALGVMERDGVLVIVGHLGTLTMIVLAVVSWNFLWNALWG